MSEKERLKPIFNSLKELLSIYEPPFVSKSNDEGKYDLWSIKEIEVEGRKRNEVYFAGIIIQSSYVGLYFMPVYIDKEVKKFFSSRLLGCLKGKSCFHIKDLDIERLLNIEAALKKGYDLYVSRGWVSLKG